MIKKVKTKEKILVQIEPCIPKIILSLDFLGRPRFFLSPRKIKTFFLKLRYLFEKLFE